MTNRKAINIESAANFPRSISAIALAPDSTSRFVEDRGRDLYSRLALKIRPDGR